MLWMVVLIIDNINNWHLITWQKYKIINSQRTEKEQWRMRKQSQYDCTMKILLLGNSGAGKSCLLMRFYENKFTPSYYNTIGVDYKLKMVDVEGNRVKMQIWDTAGQDRFKNITSSYYRGADGIIIIYDITDATSFEGVQGWLGEIDKYTDPSVMKILVGNKTDLNERRQVPSSEAAKIAQRLDLPFVQTSARDGTNVNQVFYEMARLVLASKQGNRLVRSERHQLQNANKKEKNSGCC